MKLRAQWLIFTLGYGPQTKNNETGNWDVCPKLLEWSQVTEYKQPRNVQPIVHRLLQAEETPKPAKH